MGDGVMCHACRKSPCLCRGGVLGIAVRWVTAGEETEEGAAEFLAVPVERFRELRAEAEQAWAEGRWL